ncbi:hypothetical protein EJ08DRAFT_672531 [Tothia fuscella]|uniref:R3H-associated N-terminal domain-containing protein n=1 Tax=Tothia fuscella TaxID=1048955 RepID=A0A9P4NJ17_9PEZI|nr:hypothetical protein EJ08DRAFT_672531 [Tothia fuscella]
MENTARPAIAAANITRVDVESWTEEAIRAMNSLTVTPGTAARGASVTLEIPLDEPPKTNGEGISAGEAVRAGYVLRRKTSNRDSLRHREAVLKGKEGSRQRRRWENDRLLGNPHAQPPLPIDWEVKPTYPVQSVPYYLAPLWDAGYAKQSATRKEKAQRAKKSSSDGSDSVGKVPKELREKLKRSRAAKGLLQSLEEEVRKFVQSWDSTHQDMESEPELLPDSDDDDEVVFVGRNGQMHDRPETPYDRCSDELEREKLVMDAYEDDQSARFGRWLVHSIGQYYGLRTWSLSRGDPVKRETYIGIQELEATRKHDAIRNALPRPLWAMV